MLTSGCLPPYSSQSFRVTALLLMFCMSLVFTCMRPTCSIAESRFLYMLVNKDSISLCGTLVAAVCKSVRQNESAAIFNSLLARILKFLSRAEVDRCMKKTRFRKEICVCRRMQIARAGWGRKECLRCYKAAHRQMVVFADVTMLCSCRNEQKPAAVCTNAARDGGIV